jgi:hypothetical protein
MNKLAFFAVSLICTGCNADDRKQHNSTEVLSKSNVEQVGPLEKTSLLRAKEAENMPLIKFRGTVKYLQLEGGFFAIYADDGKKYTPTNLPKAYRIAGLVVEVEGQILTDMMSFQQHGDMLKVLDVKLIDDSNAQDR